MRWFCTDGWLNSTTLLSHSPVSKEHEEKIESEKKKKKSSQVEIKTIKLKGKIEKNKQRQCRSKERENNFSLLSINKRCLDISWEAGPQYMTQLFRRIDIITRASLSLSSFHILLLSVTSCSMECPFSQFRLAVLAMSHPNLLLAPQPATLGGVERVFLA